MVFSTRMGPNASTHCRRNPTYPKPIVSKQYIAIEMGCAPCSSNFGVSRYRSPDSQAAEMYAPFATTQKEAMNQIQFVRIASAIATGIKTPRIGPPHSVISGCGSGSKKLYGRCQGSKSASVKVPPNAQPQIMWPSSWTVVMTHQDATSKTANFSKRFSIRPALFGFDS